MIFVIVLLSVIIVIQLAVTLLAFYIAWKSVTLSFNLEDRNATLINDVTDELEKLQDNLTSNHNRISKILEIPIAGDDPYIREVISAIKDSREMFAKCITVINNLDEDVDQ